MVSNSTSNAAQEPPSSVTPVPTAPITAAAPVIEKPGAHTVLAEIEAHILSLKTAIVSGVGICTTDLEALLARVKALSKHVKP